MKKIVTLILSVCLAVLALFMIYRNIHVKNRYISSTEKTFAIIKPDAVQAKNTGKIIDLIEHNEFNILGLKKLTLNKDQAKKFYTVHKDRPFYKDLVTFMTSGPIVLMVLQKDNAVKSWRDLMGATNPESAAEGTIRKLYGMDVTHNASHGSDSIENAQIEIEQFFPEF